LRRTWVSIASLLVVPWCYAEDKLVGGPYAVNVGQRSATVVWVVQSSDVTLVPDGGAQPMIAPVLRSQKVTYSGLQPGKTYSCDVPGLAGAKGSFKTAPAGPAAFQFVVFGDTRTRHDVHKRVVDAIVKAQPDFVIHTGDLVSDGHDSSQWPIFFSIEKELLAKAAFYPVLGNHERNDYRYYEFFDVQTPYYSFDWGAAHFTALDSDVGSVALSAQARQAFWDEQTRWLEDDLKKSQGSAFRFVIFHHPPFTAVKRRQGEKPPTLELVPLFERYKVTATFSGHDHNYQRHVKNGVQYVITGGGGAPLYEVDAPIPGLTEKVERIENYVTVKVEGKQARLEARALDGHLIESLELP
jgi:3',5'-cyclic AMP phosphodiesterase CpdA